MRPFLSVSRLDLTKSRLILIERIDRVQGRKFHNRLFNLLSNAPLTILFPYLSLTLSLCLSLHIFPH